MNGIEPTGQRVVCSARFRNFHAETQETAVEVAKEILTKVGDRPCGTLTRSFTQGFADATAVVFDVADQSNWKLFHEGCLLICFSVAAILILDLLAAWLIFAIGVGYVAVAMHFFINIPEVNEAVLQDVEAIVYGDIGLCVFRCAEMKAHVVPYDQVGRIIPRVGVDGMRVAVLDREGDVFCDFGPVSASDGEQFIGTVTDRVLELRRRFEVE